MFTKTAALALAGMLLVMPCQAGTPLPEKWYDQTETLTGAEVSSWQTLYSGIRVQSSDTNPGDITLVINAGSGTVGTYDPSDENPPAGLVISTLNGNSSSVNPYANVTVTFTGSSSGPGTAPNVSFANGLYMLGTSQSAAALNVQYGASVSFGGWSMLLADNLGAETESQLRITVGRPDPLMPNTDTSRLDFTGGVYINDQTVRFPETRPNDLESTLLIQEHGEVTAASMVMESGRITIEEGGSLRVGAFHTGATGYSWSTGSWGTEVNVAGGAAFASTGAAYISYGNFTIEDGATVDFLGGVEVGRFGYMNVPVAVGLGTDGGVKITSGGEIHVTAGGELAGKYFAVDHSTLTAESGSLIGGTDSFTISGSGSKVTLKGFMAEESRMIMTGGDIDFASTFRIVDPAATGTAGDLAGFEVGGSANVQINAPVSVRDGGDFGMNGGTVTLNDGGSLTIGDTGTSHSMRGNLVFNGGEAFFQNPLEWTDDGITMQQAGEMDMGGARLTFSSRALLDTSEATLTITGSGGLSILGTGSYQAGYGNDEVFMASASGGGTLHISSSALIRMTNSLQRYINSGNLDHFGKILILETDFLINDGTDSLSWKAGSYIYEYEVLQDEDGYYGLYVTGSRLRPEAEQREDLLNTWRGIIGPDASKVINDEYAGAIIQANRIVSGESGDYDAVPASGRFNAEALAGLTEPAYSGAGYNTLMLYNGSGLGMVTQAVINSNHLLLKRLEQRNGQVRRELAVASENLGSSSAWASQLLNEANENRVWAAVHYSSENSGWDEGFAGYRYRSDGVVAGYDRLFGPVVAGGAISYTDGSFRDSAALSSNSDIQTYGFHIYGALNTPEGFFLNGAAGYAYSDNQIRDARVVNGRYGWNTADYHTSSWMAAVNAGYDYRPSECLTVTGMMGLTYQRASSSDHTQYFSSGGSAGSATIQAHEVKNHSAMLPLDLSVSYTLLGDEDQLTVLFANIGYAYEFNNSGASGRISYAGLPMLGSVGIVSRHPGRHTMNLGAGFKYYYNQYEFGLSYDYTGKTKYNGHHIVGNVGIVF